MGRGAGQEALQGRRPNSDDQLSDVAAPALLDSQHFLERLVQIGDYKTQVSEMVQRLRSRAGATGNLCELTSLVDRLEDQENGYKDLFRLALHRERGGGDGDTVTDDIQSLASTMTQRTEDAPSNEVADDDPRETAALVAERTNLVMQLQQHEAKLHELQELQSELENLHLTYTGGEEEEEADNYSRNVRDPAERYVVRDDDSQTSTAGSSVPTSITGGSSQRSYLQRLYQQQQQLMPQLRMSHTDQQQSPLQRPYELESPAVSVTSSVRGENLAAALSQLDTKRAKLDDVLLEIDAIRRIRGGEESEDEARLSARRATDTAEEAVEALDDLDVRQKQKKLLAARDRLAELRRLQMAYEESINARRETIAETTPERQLLGRYAAMKKQKEAEARQEQELAQQVEREYAERQQAELTELEEYKRQEREAQQLIQQEQRALLQQKRELEQRLQEHRLRDQQEVEEERVAEMYIEEQRQELERQRHQKDELERLLRDKQRELAEQLRLQQEQFETQRQQMQQLSLQNQTAPQRVSPIAASQQYHNGAEGTARHVQTFKQETREQQQMLEQHRQQSPREQQLVELAVARDEDVAALRRERDELLALQSYLTRLQQSGEQLETEVGDGGQLLQQLVAARKAALEADSTIEEENEDDDDDDDDFDQQLAEQAEEEEEEVSTSQQQQMREVEMRHAQQQTQARAQSQPATGAADAYYRIYYDEDVTASEVETETRRLAAAPAVEMAEQPADRLAGQLQLTSQLAGQLLKDQRLLQHLLSENLKMAAAFTEAEQTEKRESPSSMLLERSVQECRLAQEKQHMEMSQMRADLSRLQQALVPQPPLLQYKGPRRPTSATTSEATSVASTAAGGTEIFESLRETIYGEVATLIAQHESRPHFLVELFRELQMLSTDFLRQRALYSLQELVTSHLTEDAPEDDDDQQDTMEEAEYLATAGDMTPSETAFAQDPLSDTAIYLNAREMTPTLEPKTGDSSELDGVIKTVMASVIPLLKRSIDEPISRQLLNYLESYMVALVAGQLELRRRRGGDFARFFTRQLSALLHDAIGKYHGRKVRDCGEDLLFDISEILFNELAFFRLMQDLDPEQTALQDDEEDDEEEGDASELDEAGDEEQTVEEEEEEDEENSCAGGVESALDEDDEEVAATSGDEEDEEDVSAAPGEDSCDDDGSDPPPAVYDDSVDALSSEDSEEEEGDDPDRDQVELAVRQQDFELTSSENCPNKQLGSEDEDEEDAGPPPSTDDDHVTGISTLPPDGPQESDIVDIEAQEVSDAGDLSGGESDIIDDVETTIIATQAIVLGDETTAAEEMELELLLARRGQPASDLDISAEEISTEENYDSDM